jgi:hypothetical protein
LLQTVIKWRIKSSVTDTKLALDPLLLTPDWIFFQKNSRSFWAWRPTKLNNPKRLSQGWNPCPAAL